MRRKKSPVPYNHSHRHLSLVGHGPLVRFLFK
jgi:hypothetical protein